MQSSLDISPAPERDHGAVRIGAVRFDRVTQREAIEAIDHLIAAGQGGYVVTPNVDHLVLASRDPELGEVYRRASLSLADGQPIMWMTRILRAPLPEKVSGSDLIDPLMAAAARRGWRVFLFGATPEVSAQAAEALQARHRWLRIVGRDSSPWDPKDGVLSTSVVEAIRRSGADLVVVALGCPKQELWMSRHEAAIGPGVAIGLGGSLDFVAGATRRAPRWMSRAGFEWLYRLAQEPRRLAYRYLVRDTQIIPVFLGTLRSRLAAGRVAGNGVPDPASPPHIELEPDTL
jgi:N-acetylglucosaminyldiphosphoundecaprenol N-acetyl-beta-D-mannosaminyltransferase